jgi:pyridoxine 5-phosphate synthase
VATLREARGGVEPDPAWAVAAAELGGADGITIHLREDRRHINDRDVRLLRQVVQTRLNLEMALSDEVVRVALEVMPDQVTFVPERREELTTEGGLDVASQFQRIGEVAERFRQLGVRVSLFIDPTPEQVRAARHAVVEAVELHTGRYANAMPHEREARAQELRESATMAAQEGLAVHAGHGLNYRNVGAVAAIPEVRELNIGHSIVSRAVFVGLERAVAQMKEAMRIARSGGGEAQA